MQTMKIVAVKRLRIFAKNLALVDLLGIVLLRPL